MVIDEADIPGSKYVNTLVGDIEQPETTYLLHCKILDASPNQQTVVHAIDQWSPTPGPRTGTGPWVSWCRSAQGHYAIQIITLVYYITSPCYAEVFELLF